MANLQDQLRADMTAAMKAKDKETTKVLRAVLSVFQTEMTSGEEFHELTDDVELKILTKQVRQRRDSAEEYAKGGRQDLADVELAEAEILAKYLPAPLTDDELATLVDEAVAASGPDASMKQMGQIVRAVNEKAAGRADGGKIAGLVKQRLSAK